MKKENVLWIILKLMFAVIFNTVFFVVSGFEHGVSVWLSYGFIHLAYFMLLITPKLIRKGKSVAVFGFSLHSISSVYFIIELITGIVFILMASESYKATLVIQLIIAGIYGVMLISSMIANERTADAEENRQYQIDYFKSASARLKRLLDAVVDKDVKKKLEMVYDELYTSPVKSHPTLHQLEERILDLINELSEEINSGEKESILTLLKSLLDAINERNSQARNLN